MRKLVTIVLNIYNVDKIVYTNNNLNIVFNSSFDAINNSIELKNNNINHILKDNLLIFKQHVEIIIKTDKLIITIEQIFK